LKLNVAFDPGATDELNATWLNPHTEFPDGLSEPRRYVPAAQVVVPVLLIVTDTGTVCPAVIVDATLCVTNPAPFVPPPTLPTVMTAFVDICPNIDVASLESCHWKLYVPGVVGAMAWKVTLSCCPGLMKKGVSNTVLPPHVVLFKRFCEISLNCPPGPSQA
jgi:hypothetical protein